jgi:HSP20 family protein
MDEQTKKYFAELNNSIEDPEVELVRSGSSVRSRGELNVRTHSSVHDEAEGQLTIDVFQTPHHIVIESTIAGVGPEDLDIDITNESVTIQGKRERLERVRDEDYIYQECYWGRFSRSIILPQEVDPDGAEASLKNGILSIRLPKLDRHRAKKLKVHFT